MAVAARLLDSGGGAWLRAYTGRRCSEREHAAYAIDGHDRSLHGNWLSAFSQSAGGRLIYVPVGTANFAFDRILRETSAYYLLGVEPAPADRDGRPRKLDVKVKRHGVSVRSRQWVVIPPKG